MPIPVVVYVIASGVVTGAAAAYVVKNSDGTISEIAEEAAQDLIEAGTPVVNMAMEEIGAALTYLGGELGELGEDIKEGLVDAAGQFGNLSLNFVRGLASAVIEGIDDAYDLVRDKLRGKEPDVIAGFTVGTISILAAVFIYQRVKAREI
tara:strand:- start:480 stop:929 length:450 start_codon:yes stop_codon:yes gene_type:complete